MIKKKKKGKVSSQSFGGGSMPKPSSPVQVNLLARKVPKKGFGQAKQSKVRKFGDSKLKPKSKFQYVSNRFIYFKNI